MAVDSDAFQDVKPNLEEAVEVKKEVEEAAPTNGQGSFKEGANNTSGPTSGPNGSPAPEQLTIFYGGSVLVFDAIPPEKVREIILLAAAAVKPTDMKNSVPGTPVCGTPVLTRSPSLQSATGALPSPTAKLGSSLCKLQAELPIARRHSLQRFFEKRRDRLCSRNPYLSSATKKSETGKPDFSIEGSPEAGCFGKPLPMEKEIQPKAAANLA